MQIQQAIIILENLRIQQASAIVTAALTKAIHALKIMQNEQDDGK